MGLFHACRWPHEAGAGFFVPQKRPDREKGERILSLKRTDKDKGKAPAAETKPAETAPAAAQDRPEGEPAEKKQPGEDPEPEKAPEEAPASGKDEGVKGAGEPGEEEAPPEKTDGEPSGGEQEAPKGGRKAGQEEPAAEEETPEQTPAEPAQETEPGGQEELAQVKADLLAARSKLAAYEAGVAPAMIADAVTLATAQAQTSGGVTEEAVAKAMADVLKRHPEWKAAGADRKKAGGFKLGADPDSGTAKKQGAQAPKNTKRWNRFK